MSVTQLRSFNLSTLSYLEKKAFFLNIYNSLVIHAQVAVGAPKSMFQRATFFGSVTYDIGGLLFSLNDIEHGLGLFKI